MLETINNVCLMITDPILNWMLILPRSVIILLIAVVTSCVITLSRKWSTNQDWLKRAEEDCDRQNELAKEAKRRGDKDAERQHKMTVGLIKMRGFKYEGKPLLLAIIPIALLATWGFNRLSFYPPADGEPVAVKMYFPRSAMDSLAYIVPQEGVEVEGGLVQRIGEDYYPPSVTLWDKGLDKVIEGFTKGFEWVVTKVFGAVAQPPAPLGGLATWRVKAKARPEPYRLQFVYDGKLYTKEFLVGQRIHSTQADIFDLEAPVQAIEQVLRPYQFLGFIGGFGVWIPACMVGYLAIVSALFIPVKKLFKVY